LPVPRDRRYIPPEEILGDTTDLKRRLQPSRPWWLTLIGPLLIAAALYFAIQELKPAFYVAGDGDTIMFVNGRTGRVGACVVGEESVRCLRQDWSSGPLDTGGD
jgi:hypothetical protein